MSESKCENKASHGSCLCGAVKILATEVKPEVGACHCDMCRKWAGGPLMAVDCGTEVGFTGHENIGIFSSSEWAERGFCKQCGSGLFYKLKLTGQYIVPAGLLEIESALEFDHQLFVDQKPNYYCFSNDTKKLTGEQVFAQFSAE